jgi:hypothetical protein
MYDDSPKSVGSPVGLAYPAQKPTVSIQQIDNGFLVSWWNYKAGKNYAFHSPNLDSVSEQLKGIYL